MARVSEAIDPALNASQDMANRVARAERASGRLSGQPYPGAQVNTVPVPGATQAAGAAPAPIRPGGPSQLLQAANEGLTPRGAPAPTPAMDLGTGPGPRGPAPVQAPQSAAPAPSGPGATAAPAAAGAVEAAASKPGFYSRMTGSGMPPAPAAGITSRVAGATAPILTAGIEALRVKDDMSVPGMTTLDKTARVAEGAGRFASTMAGGAAGAALGAPAGGVGGIIGGIAGGIGGYFAPEATNAAINWATDKLFGAPPTELASQKAASLRAAEQQTPAPAQAAPAAVKPAGLSGSVPPPRTGESAPLPPGLSVAGQDATGAPTQVQVAPPPPGSQGKAGAASSGLTSQQVIDQANQAANTIREMRNMRRAAEGLPPVGQRRQRDTSREDAAAAAEARKKYEREHPRLTPSDLKRMTPQMRDAALRAQGQNDALLTGTERVGVESSRAKAQAADAAADNEAQVARDQAAAAAAADASQARQEANTIAMMGVKKPITMKTTDSLGRTLEYLADPFTGTPLSIPAEK